MKASFLGIFAAFIWTLCVIYQLRKSNHGYILGFPDRGGLGSRNQGSIVVAGQFVAGDIPCNIAQMDLDNDKWILKGKL